MLPKEGIEYLNKIPEDEPVFILRAQDVYAPSIIALWTSLMQAPLNPRKCALTSSLKKARQAQYDIKIMRIWQNDNSDKTKIPD